MKKLTSCLVLKILVIITMALLWASSAHASQNYAQIPIILDAKDILPKDLVQGKNYKVQDKVSNDGLINVYQVTTDDGLLTLESTAALMIRINELRALIGMEELDRKGVFKDSVVAGVKAPIQGAV